MAEKVGRLPFQKNCLQAYFLSTRNSEKVRVPQDMRARICTGMRAASSEYQTQIFPLSRRAPEAVSGCTRIVLKVPAGVLTCSRSSTCARTVSVAPPSLIGKLYVLPGSNGSDAT